MHGFKGLLWYSFNLDPYFPCFFVSKWMYTATCTEAYSREVAIPVEIGPVLSKTNAAVKRAAM